MIEVYKKRALEKKVNTYFICEGDKDFNIKKVEVVPANPTCNCYSVAKSFTAMAIGLLYDKKLIQKKYANILLKFTHFPNVLFVFGTVCNIIGNFKYTFYIFY